MLFSLEDASPDKKKRPEEGFSKPARIKERVVFPDPLSPRIPTLSPLKISRLILSRAFFFSLEPG